MLSNVTVKNWKLFVNTDRISVVVVGNERLSAVAILEMDMVVPIVEIRVWLIANF
jgi:hypothetical protein